jgi:hypothetical protein
VNADRHDRTSRFYDLYDLPIDLLARTSWRARRFDLMSPLTRRPLGLFVNRDTERNLHADAAGLRIERVQRWGIWRETVASRHR